MLFFTLDIPFLSKCFYKLLINWHLVIRSPKNKQHSGYLGKKTSSHELIKWRIGYKATNILQIKCQKNCCIPVFS